MQHAEVTAEADDAPSREAILAFATSSDLDREQAIFAATMSGLYRSGDGGENWMRLRTGAQALALLSVAVSPSFATDGVLFAGAVGGGLLRSADKGATWSLAYLGPRPPYCAALALSPEFGQDGHAFAGTMDDGVFVSRDRGLRWEPRSFGLLDLSVLALGVSPGFADNETLYAATASGLFRSRNGARAWREIASPGSGSAVQCLALSPSPPGNDVLFVGTDGAGVFRSDDDGTGWQPAGETLADTCINALVLSPDFARDRTLLALTSSELHLSHDAGDHWQRVVRVPDALCLAATPPFAGGGAVVVGRAEQGVVRSSDLLRWHASPIVQAASLV